MKLAWLLHVYKHVIFHSKFSLADILYSVFKVGTVISSFLLFWGESVDSPICDHLFCAELVIEFEGAWWEGMNWRTMLGYFSESQEGHINNLYHDDWDFPDGDGGKEHAWQRRRLRQMWVQSLDPEETLGEGMTTTPVLLPGEFHGQSSLEGYSP